MTEGWPDDRVTGAADVPSIVRHCAGPVGDEDRYEILGPADGPDEGWHVLDRDAGAGDALFTLVTLRPTPRAGQDAEGHQAEQEMWRERAAGLTRVRHERLAGVVTTFRGPGPHAPGRAVADDEPWSYAVLEQASGRSVADWLRDDPGAPVQERLTVLATAAGVLQELHRGSDHVPPLVHGDISPRTVRLGGFWPSDGVRLAGASLGGLRRGPLHGDPASPYTAPEVRAGGLPSAASDVFGFGATAITVLTGQPPVVGHDGEPDLDLVRRQLGAAPYTAPHPGMAELLLQAVATDPHDRPDRLPLWVNALRAHVDPSPAPEALPVVPVGHVVAEDPARAAAGARSLPRRPVAVVVGALVLATAGAGIAIAAVQQGRLKDVPNPVAIVQPAPVTQSTDALGVPSTQAPSAAQGSEQEDSAPATTTRRRPSSSSSGAAGTSPGTVPGVPPTSAPGVPVPGEALVPPAGEVPTVPPLIPPAVSGPFPPSAAPLPATPPVTTPPVTTPPVTTPPVITPPVITPPVATSPPPSSAPPASPPPSSPAPSSPAPTSSPSLTTEPTSPSSSPTTTVLPSASVTVEPPQSDGPSFPPSASGRPPVRP